MGEKVGDGDDARGRNGVTFVGNDDYDVGINFNDGYVDSCLLYGTTVRNFNGEVNWFSAVSGGEFIGSVIDSSEQFNASSGVKIRNSTFQNYSGDRGSIIWNSGYDIRNSNFIANLGSGAIEHPDSGENPYLYDNLQFAGNSFDINSSSTTENDIIIQATNGSNPSTAITGNVNSTVDIQNSVTLTLTNIVIGSEVRIYKSNPTGTFPVELAGTESEADGIFEYTYNFTGNFDADIVIVNTGYVYFRQNNNTLSSTPATIKINQVFDRNYDNP